MLDYFTFPRNEYERQPQSSTAFAILSCNIVSLKHHLIHYCDRCQQILHILAGREILMPSVASSTWSVLRPSHVFHQLRVYTILLPIRERYATGPAPLS